MALCPSPPTSRKLDTCAQAPGIISGMPASRTRQSSVAMALGLAQDSSSSWQSLFTLRVCPTINKMQGFFWSSFPNKFCSRFREIQHMLCSLLEQLKIKKKSYFNSAQQPPGAHGHIWSGQKQPGHGESNKTQPAPACSSSHLHTQGEEQERPLSMKCEPLQALRNKAASKL